MAAAAASTKSGVGPNGASWIVGFQGDEAPYSYKTDTGEQYDVTVVTYKFGKKVETGKISFANGDTYEGDWSMGSKNGKGIYRCANGVVYDGRWKDDMRHGYGTCTYSNGDMYKGKWAKNQKHGDGCYTFANGNTYTGDWRSDRACGKGVCEYSNGDRYEGDWKDDRAHGHGVYVYSSGERYDGAWVKGKKSGHGSFRFLCGDVYTGEFREDDVWGQGKKVYAEGGTYEGDWVKGLRHGKGKLTVKGGKVLHEGDWRNDEPYCRQTERVAGDNKDADEKRLREELEKQVREQAEREKKDLEFKKKLVAQDKAAAAQAEREAREAAHAKAMEGERQRKALQAEEELAQAARYASKVAAAEEAARRKQEADAERVCAEAEEAAKKREQEEAARAEGLAAQEAAMSAAAQELLELLFQEQVRTISQEVYAEEAAAAAAAAANELERTASARSDDELSGEETARTQGGKGHSALQAEDCNTGPQRSVGRMCDPNAWGLRPSSPMARPVTPFVRAVRENVPSLGLQPLDADAPEWGIGQSHARSTARGVGDNSFERPLSARRPASPRRTASPRTSALQLLSSDKPDEAARFFGDGDGGESQRRPGSSKGRDARGDRPLSARGSASAVGDLRTQLGNALKDIGASRLQIMAPASSLNALNGTLSGGAHGLGGRSRALQAGNAGSASSWSSAGPLAARPVCPVSRHNFSKSLPCTNSQKKSQKRASSVSRVQAQILKTSSIK